MLPRVSEASSSVLANQYWLHCRAFEWARGLFSAPLDAFVPGWRSSHPRRPPISKEAVSMVTVPDRLVHCTKYDVWIMEGGTRLHVFISWKHFRGWWFHCFDLCRLFTKKGEVICLFSLWGIETHLNKEVICTNLTLKYQFRVQLSYWKLIFVTEGQKVMCWWLPCSASPVRHDSLMFGLLSNLISCSCSGARVYAHAAFSNQTQPPFFLYSGSIYCPKLRTSHSILIFHECDWWISLSNIWVWFSGFVHSHVYVHASSWRKPQWTHLGLPSCCQNIWIQYFFLSSVHWLPVLPFVTRVMKICRRVLECID